MDFIKCKDCSNEFTLSEGEIKFFKSHVSDDGRPMALPKRCNICRKKKRDEKIKS